MVVQGIPRVLPDRAPHSTRSVLAGAPRTGSAGGAVEAQVRDGRRPCRGPRVAVVDLGAPWHDRSSPGDPTGGLLWGTDLSPTRPHYHRGLTGRCLLHVQREPGRVGVPGIAMTGQEEVTA